MFATLSLLTAALISQAAAQGAKHHTYVTTHKDEVGEVCPELKAGQTLNFKFKSSEDVEFNLHYHLDDKVEYPIKPQTLKSINKSYKAPIDQTYCLMWKGISEKPSKIQVGYGIAELNVNDIQPKNIGEALPMYQPRAEYPAQAINNNIEGDVVFLLDISPSGKPVNIRILSEHPKGIFAKDAKKAISKWRFKPRIIDTKPVLQEDMLYRMEFRLNN